MKGKLFLLLTLLVCFGIAAAQTNLLVNADLETVEPGFWSKLNDGMGSAVVSWSWDGGANGSMKSFHVYKPNTTTDMVGWVSVNNANLYWNRTASEGGNDTYVFGFWAKTQDVNTAPATDDAKIGVWFKFFEAGNLLGEQLVAVDQSVATTDWTEYTGALFISGKPDSIIAVAVMGKDATGHVWFDNISCNTQSKWTMGIFNGNAETPVGWMQWSASNEEAFVSLVEDPDNAHSGTHSALLIERDDNADEIVFYSEPVPAEPGKWYKISGWIKTDSINTGETWYPTNVIPDRDNDRMGYCFFFHRAPLREAWDLTGGDQFFYIDQRDSSSGWTYYTVVAKAPDDAAGLSMRARFTSFPKGYAWYDDFSIEEIEAVIVSVEDPATRETTLSYDYQLLQNYPNPFNPETIIEYQVPKMGQVKLVIYNTLGQKVRTLVDKIQSPGTYQVIWDGLDDYGQRVATGVYIYQLKGENALITKKMLLIK